MDFILIYPANVHDAICFSKFHQSVSLKLPCSREVSFMCHIDTKNAKNKFENKCFVFQKPERTVGKSIPHAKDGSLELGKDESKKRVKVSVLVTFIKKTHLY